ncbi:MAG: YnbE family lipoprotein [Gammaproteobacteria bacterium]|nr:YnbE family lipoprotein [Gammaproteobacteria bacterium]
MRTAFAALLSITSLVACNPTIRIEPSDKPIKIDMTVKIQHEIKVKVEKDLDKAMSEHGDIF